MAHVKGMRGFEAGFFPHKGVFCVVDSWKDFCWWGCTAFGICWLGRREGSLAPRGGGGRRKKKQRMFASGMIV